MDRKDNPKWKLGNAAIFCDKLLQYKIPIQSGNHKGVATMGTHGCRTFECQFAVLRSTAVFRKGELDGCGQWVAICGREEDGGQEHPNPTGEEADGKD